MIKFRGLINLRIAITIYKAAGLPIITPQTSVTRITVANWDGKVILNAFAKYYLGMSFVKVKLAGIVTF